MSGYLAMLAAKARGSASRIRSRPDALFERANELLPDGPGSPAEAYTGHEEHDDRALLSRDVATNIDGHQLQDGGEGASVVSGDHRKPGEARHRQRLIPVLDEHGGAKPGRAPEIRPSRAELKPVERQSAEDEVNPGSEARGDAAHRQIDFQRVNFTFVEPNRSASLVTPVAADGRYPKAAAEISGAPGLTTASGRQQDRLGRARRASNGHAAPTKIRSPAGLSEDRDEAIGLIEEKGVEHLAEVRAPCFKRPSSARSGIPVGATGTDAELQLTDVATAVTPREGARRAAARDTGSEPPQGGGSAVHVSIGRIEIRGQGQPPSPALPRRPAPPRLDLKDYLTRRMRGDSHG